MLKSAPIILMVLVALAGADVIAAAGQESTVVRQVTVPREEIFDGVIEAVHQSTVTAQTAGRVTAVLFDVDDHVDRDSVIVQLRDTEQRARLEQAEGKLKEAQALVTQAQADYRRKESLFKQQAISASERERADAAFKAARAGLDAAQAQVDEAREQLEHTVIRAPYSGIVVERMVEPGESVQPGVQLMTGLSLERLRVTTQIPERLVDTVRQWRKARVLLPAAADASLEVEGLTVSPRADRVAHTFEVRAPLPAGQHGLYPGMSVKVAITTGEAQRLLVPAAAVVHRSEVTAVYVVQEQGIVFRQVRIGRAYADGMREVLAGLVDGERVALDPVQAGILLKEQQAGRGNE